MSLLEYAVGVSKKSEGEGDGNGNSLTNERFLKKYEKIGKYLRFYSYRFRDQEEALQNMCCWSYGLFLNWSQRGRKTFPTSLAKYSYYKHLNGRVFGEPERFGGANHLKGRDVYWAQRRGKISRESLLFEDDSREESERFFSFDEDVPFKIDFEDWLQSLRPPCSRKYFLLRVEGYSVNEIASLLGVCIQTVSKFSNDAIDDFCQSFGIPAERLEYLKNHAAHRRPVESPETVPKALPYEKYIERRRRHYPQSRKTLGTPSCL
jgi:DNA-directed RNA polymerase specialized sigma24 family protein